MPLSRGPAEGQCFHKGFAILSSCLVSRLYKAIGCHPFDCNQRPSHHYPAANHAVQNQARRRTGLADPLLV